MNKYLYPIKNLKTKSYIKWWLYRYLGSKGANYILSEILEGTSFTLTDSVNKKFNLFQIFANTTQDGEPTPENPVDIKNTGDSGNVNVKVQNKNLISLKSIDGKISEVTYKGQENEILLCNGTKSGGGYVKFTQAKIHLKAGTYTCNSNLVSGTIKRNGTDYNIVMYICKVSTDSIVGYSIGYVGRNNKKSFTLNEEDDYYIRFAVWDDGVVFDNAVVTIQIEQGSTATPYQAHEEQNISFPLAQGQKLMQGDYLADDGIHHVRKQVQLTGNENWYYDDGCFVTTTYNDVKHTDTSGKIIVLCSHFMGVVTNYRGSLSEGCIAKVIGSNTQIAIHSSQFAGVVEDFKTFLQNNNVIIQYQLENEVIDPYTEEQQAVYDQIKALRTYKPVTHISSEDETPANLKIQYYKEATNE